MLQKKSPSEIVWNGAPWIDDSRVFVDNYTETTVELSRTFNPEKWDKFDCPSYLETKLNKALPEDVDVRLTKTVDERNGVQTLILSITINHKFTSMETVMTLFRMVVILMEVAQTRLSEPSILKAIAADCKPWILTHDENTTSESAN